MQLKKDFEIWFESDSYPLEANWFELDSDGEYARTTTYYAWIGWFGFAQETFWRNRTDELLNVFKDFDEQVKNS